MPDIKVDLNINRSKSNLIPLLLNPSLERQSFKEKVGFGYKCPFYTTKTRIVPYIPSELATNRFLPGISSNLDYPIFSIHGSSDDLLELQRKLRFDTKQIMNMFNQK